MNVKIIIMKIHIYRWAKFFFLNSFFYFLGTNFFCIFICLVFYASWVQPQILSQLSKSLLNNLKCTYIPSNLVWRVSLGGFFTYSSGLAPMSIMFHFSSVSILFHISVTDYRFLISQCNRNWHEAKIIFPDKASLKLMLGPKGGREREREIEGERERENPLTDSEKSQ